MSELSMVIKNVSYDSKSLKLIIQGEIQSLFSDTFNLQPNSASFYLKFNNLNLSDYLTIVDKGDLKSMYPGDLIINEADHLIMIGDQTCSPYSMHDGKNFEETIYIRDQNILILVVGDLMMKIEPNSKTPFRIELLLSTDLPEKTELSLDFSPSNISYPIGLPTDFGDDEEKVTNFKVLFEEMLYLFNGFMEFPCYTDDAYFMIKGELDESEIEVNINSLKEGSMIKCVNGFHKVQKVYKFSIQRMMDLVVFPPQSVKNEECAFVPYRQTTLTPAHYVQINQSFFKSSAIEKMNESVSLQNKFVDFIYHIHVDYDDKHNYAYCNGMLTDVWGNLNPYIKSYSQLNENVVIPDKCLAYL